MQDILKNVGPRLKIVSEFSWIEVLHVSIYRKVTLVRLCQTAFDLELDVLTTTDDKDMDK